MLSPADLSRLGGLELIARAVVEGAVAGGHRSPFHGYSAEFSQHRAYRPGDDLKYVDWKLSARTDRLYTKQFRETTNARIIIAVDASGSMRYGGRLTKARYAQMLAAAVAFVAASHGDEAGLISCGDQPILVVPPGAGRLQLTRVYASLERLPFEGAADLTGALRLARERLGSRGLLLLISDLYDLDERSLREFRRAVQAGHDVSVFHVLSREERSPDLGGNTELEDLETGDRLSVSPSMLSEYRTRFEAFLEGARRGLVRNGIDYSLVSTDEPVSAVLRRYLFRRAA